MKRICILLICLLSGCATQPMNDVGVIAAFSARLSNIEKQLGTTVPKTMGRERQDSKLSQGQKEFITLILDYLSEE